MYRNAKKLMIVLIGLFFFSPSVSFAQGWEKIIGGEDRDFGSSIAATQDGNYVVAGLSYDGLGNDPDRNIYLMKIDIHGNILWTQYFGFIDGTENVKKVIATSDGGFLMAGYGRPSGQKLQAYLVKADANGVEEWSNVYQTGNFNGEAENVIESSLGDFLFIGYEDRGGDDDLTIGRVQSDGTLLWMKTYDERMNDHGFALAETPQLDIIAAGFTGGGNQDNDLLVMKVNSAGDKIWATASDSIRIARFVHLHDNGDISTIGDRNSAANGSFTRLDASGNILWTKNVAAAGTAFISSALATVDGGFIVTGNGFINTQNFAHKAFLLKLDNVGDEEWLQYYGSQPANNGIEVVQTPDQGYIMSGYVQDSSQNFEIYLVKTDSLGRLYSNIIEGRIVNDSSMDCTADPLETGLTNWVVEATKSNGQRFFGSSDSTGFYEVTADTGTYHVVLHPPNAYWSACTDSIPLTLVNFYDTTQVDFALQADIECPYMVVDIATPFLRRCFPNVYTVNYCNEGTITADSAYVDITLDPYLTFDASSIPAQMLSTDVYRFQLGDVAIGQCARFTFTTIVDCDSTVLGQTHCVEAHIYPDSLCLPLNNSWSGAFIEVGAECQGSALNFTIENTGSGSMGNPLRYVIIEDAILLMTAPFDLNSGISQDIPLPNNSGSTYLLYAQQEPGAPGNSVPILSVEGCVVTPGAPFSTGFVNQFPQNDLDPFIEIDCRRNRGAYDPNDKQGFPIGYGQEHLIEANTEIEYLIRFQNTGTDTAFKVIVQDTLSQWLNPATIRPGASSHPYQFKLSKGGAVEFTFDNIMLPDSNINWAASNGFVKFRIAQYLDNPVGTRIENRAAIFFDFNAPVLTNTTFHTIGEDLIDITLDTQDPELPLAASIKVYPNPMQHSARFDLSGLNIQDGQFELFSTSGQLVQSIRFNEEGFTFERGALPAGFYFFSIKEEGQVIGKGKVVIQ